VSRHFWPRVSGMSAYAENLVRQLAQSGSEVTLVTQHQGAPDGPPDPGRVPDGVELVAVEASGERRVRHGEPADFEADVDTLTRTVIDLHERRPFDVLHAQFAYPTGLATLRAAHTVGRPAVVTVQGVDGRELGSCCDTHRQLVRAVFDHASALVIGSPSFGAEVVARHGVDPARFSLVPGATDPDRFAPRERADLARLGDPVTLLFHGTVQASKGVLDLLDAVALLRQDGVGVRLLVSGPGPDTGLVAERVRELGLDADVELLGAVDYGRAPELYRRGDMFVSPSYAEGFPVTILEAMASGLPVVSTDVVGVRDCVRPEDNGVLVPRGDPFALAAGIRRLITDDVLRRRLAERAHSDVRLRWSWPVVAKQLTAIYDTVHAGVPQIPDPPVDAHCPFRRTGLP
jgi:glycogen(starch) synthase